MKQKFDIDLDEIVPEYQSGLSVVRNLFFKRFELALNFLKTEKINSVIDIGCGNGRFTRLIRERFDADIDAIDNNQNTESLNNRFEGIRFIKADVTTYKFDRTYDAVTCLDVLEHFEDVDSIVERIKSLLNPNGVLIISAPVESFFYKCGRFLIKGSFSQESGPGAGMHYHNARQLSKLIAQKLQLIERRKIRLFCFHAFDVLKFRKIDR
ncbi:MAG: class I SAM-dependent methyltransferase [Calditrichaeota bacterium]|nr:class I SAM-dependent methyltransferase [Calditrichota bacterium]